MFLLISGIIAVIIGPLLTYDRRLDFWAVLGYLLRGYGIVAIVLGVITLVSV